MALSAAEKQAAYRDRRREEDEYAARQVAVTRATYGDGPVRLARSEKYARWRVREHRAGEVAYL